jgi:hypothetical protein
MGSILSRVKKSSAPAEESKMAPLAFSHYAKAQSTYKPPLIANENAYLGDVYSRYVFVRFTTQEDYPPYSIKKSEKQYICQAFQF